MPEFGGYPAIDVLTAGDEVSSTGEGREVILLESDLVHPTHGDAFADNGDPVVFGATGLRGVGVVLGPSAIAATDLMSIDTEGIWGLSVVAVNDGGNSAIAGGDLLYINTTTAVISKINNTATQIPFGIAFGIVNAGVTGVISVKVHFDPSLDSQDRMYKTVESGVYNYGKQWTGLLEAGQSTGVAGYFSAQIDGQQAGGIYGLGIWIEPQDTFIDDGNLLVLLDIGLYEGGGGADLTSARLVGLQMMYPITQNPATLHWFRLNLAAPGGAMTAIFAAANPTSLAYAAGEAGTGVIGTIPFAEIVGVGIVYIDVHAGSA